MHPSRHADQSTATLRKPSESRLSSGTYRPPKSATFSKPANTLLPCGATLLADECCSAESLRGRGCRFSHVQVLEPRSSSAALCGVPSFTCAGTA